MIKIICLMEGIVSCDCGGTMEYIGVFVLYYCS